MPDIRSFERTEYQQVKADLHRKILDRLDLEKLGRTPGDAAREEVLVLIRNMEHRPMVRINTCVMLLFGRSLGPGGSVAVGYLGCLARPTAAIDKVRPQPG